MKYEYDLGTLYQGDCLEVLRELEAESVDSVVTDPPAGIAFMNLDFDNPQAWQFPISKHGFTDGGDRVAAPSISSSRNPNCRKCKRHKRGWKDIPGCECDQPDFDALERQLESRDIFVGWMTEVMRECLRILKPGGHALVWSIPRTSHWTATALEEAGFEIRDSILHLFGQGFPKSLNIGKAIDKRRASNDQIRPWLRSLGTKEEIAQAAGVTPRQVDHWLGENTQCPQTLTEDRFLKLCACFGGVPEWADSMYEKLGEKLGEFTHSRSGGEDFAKRPGSEAAPRTVDVHATATPEAAQWEGWGTSLKPAVEIWWLVRKPLRESTVAEQVLKTGTGGINVDGSRVTTTENLNGGAYSGERREKEGTWQSEDRSEGKGSGFRPGSGEYQQPKGRWPANVVLSHSPECVKLGTKEIQGITGGTTVVRKNGLTPGDDRTASAAGRFAAKQQPDRRGYSNEDGLETVEDWECVSGCPVRALDYQGQGQLYSDSGGASRFFHNFEPEYDAPFFYTGKITSGERKQDLEEEGLINTHPTVKSIKLMTFLVRLITPPGGTVLDPFAGSGSTLVAAVNNSFHFIGIEKDPEYIEIAKGRLNKAVEREVDDQNQRDMYNDLFGD